MAKLSLSERPAACRFRVIPPAVPSVEGSAERSRKTRATKASSFRGSAAGDADAVAPGARRDAREAVARAGGHSGHERSVPVRVAGAAERDLDEAASEDAVRRDAAVDHRDPDAGAGQPRPPGGRSAVDVRDE